MKLFVVHPVNEETNTGRPFKGKGEFHLLQMKTPIDSLYGRYICRSRDGFRINDCLILDITNRHVKSLLANDITNTYHFKSEREKSKEHTVVQV